MKPSVLIDTGPIVAIFNRSDAAHAICVATLASLEPPLVTTWPVITEAAFLLRKDLSQIHKLLDSIDQGLFRLAWLEESDMAGIRAILSKYADQGFQLADLSLMHVAERQDIEVVFTLDRRDFTVFIKQNGRRLEIVPE
ncbi:MAG: PIN domain-containing protein [Pirellulaceae bacterium]